MDRTSVATATAVRYYVVSSEYVGPNAADRLNSHTYRVVTEPWTTNMSHEPRTSGWLGTTSDWAAYAHGEYETLAGATAWIEAELSELGYRLDDDTDDWGEDEVARYVVGHYEEWDAESSTQWCWAARDEVSAETTDDEIEVIVESCVADGHSEGYEFDECAVRRMLVERRDELNSGEED